MPKETNQHKKSTKQKQQVKYQKQEAQTQEFSDTNTFEYWTLPNRIRLLLWSAAIVGGIILIFKYCFILVAPFMIAYLIALAIEPLVCRCARIFRGKMTCASILIVIILTILCFGLLGYLFFSGICELKKLVQNLDYYLILVRQMSAKVCLDMDGWFGLHAGCCMDLAERVFSVFIEKVKTDSGTTIHTALKWSVPIAGKVLFAIGTVVVCLMCVVYLGNLLEPIRSWRKKSIYSEELELIFAELKKLICVYFKVQGIILMINSAICIVGFVLLKNSYAVLFGILTGVVDALPIFGSGTVLIPWAIIMLLTHKVTQAAILFSLYLITYFVREIMESKCMGDSLGIAPFTMLVVIFAGFIVYGVIGFILGPVSFILIKALIGYLKTSMERGKLENV